jgi:hypothetical protein
MRPGEVGDPAHEGPVARGQIEARVKRGRLRSCETRPAAGMGITGRGWGLLWRTGWAFAGLVARTAATDPVASAPFTSPMHDKAIRSSRRAPARSPLVAACAATLAHAATNAGPALVLCSAAATRETDTPSVPHCPHHPHRASRILVRRWCAAHHPEKKKAAFRRFPERNRGLLSRGDRIRTCDPLVPNQVLYQAEPLPDAAFRRNINRAPGGLGPT